MQQDAPHLSIDLVHNNSFEINPLQKKGPNGP